MNDRFNDVLDLMRVTHEKKAHDYGASDDPYGNFRPSLGFGIEPWIGVMLRQSDKVARVQSFIQRGELFNESVEDSLLDNAVYAVLAYCLYLEKEVEEQRDGSKDMETLTTTD